MMQRPRPAARLLLVCLAALWMLPAFADRFYSPGKSWIIIAVRPSPESMYDFDRFHVGITLKYTVRYFQVANGWLVAAIGPVADAQAAHTMQDFIYRGQIPPDSFLSAGREFIRQTDTLQMQYHEFMKNKREGKRYRK